MTISGTVERMRLRDWLKSVNKPVEAFAHEIGVNRRTVYKYLAGHRPHWHELERIFVATEGRVTPNDFLPAEVVQQVNQAA